MRCLLPFLLLLATFSHAQKFGRIYVGQTRMEIESDFDRQIKEGKEEKTINFSHKRTTPDSLRYTVKNEVECFSMNVGIQKNSVCNYQEYDFNCTSCAERHMFDMIKAYKLRRKSDIGYISPWPLQVLMIEKRFGVEEDRLLLTFRVLDLPRKEYKALYRRLKKSPLNQR